METPAEKEVRERPILFSTPMVKAIIDLLKIKTRRTRGLDEVNKRPDDFIIDEIFYSGAKVTVHFRDGNQSLFVDCPFGNIGDILWVRETWAEFAGMGDNIDYVYKADGIFDTPAKEHLRDMRWRPSIFMPKEACRIKLEITGIRVERLQDISEDDAKAEGVPEYLLPIKPTEDGSYYSYAFNCLWNEINGKESWNENPWVWMIEFKKK